MDGKFKDDKQAPGPDGPPVVGCMMPAGVDDGDFSSLKEAAQTMLESGSWLGLNPHKVKRLCVEFRRLREKAGFSQALRRRVIKTLTWMVADTRHRFDDCRNNFEAASDDETASMAAGGYSAELTEAIELLAELEKGIEQPAESAMEQAYKKGFEDARQVILEKVREIVK